MQIRDLVRACHQYMEESLKDASGPWASVLFCVASEMRIPSLMTNSANQLASKALTCNSSITPLSAALRMLDDNGQQEALLSTLQCGISTAVMGAVPSEALLVVMIMRLDQLAGCVAGQTSSSSSHTLSTNSSTGESTTTSSSRSRSSSSSSTCRMGPLLHEESLVDLLGLVNWESLQPAELKALFSQSASYDRKTQAAGKVREHLANEAAVRLCTPGTSLESPEPKQQAHESVVTADNYLAVWWNEAAAHPSVRESGVVSAVNGQFYRVTYYGYSRQPADRVELAVTMDAMLLDWQVQDSS